MQSEKKEIIKFEGEGRIRIADHYPMHIRIKISHGTSYVQILCVNHKILSKK